MAEPVFYGSDTYCLTDLQLVDVQVTDPVRLIGQRLVRRLTTPRGALGIINDDPDGGLDVRQYINAKLPPSAITTAQADISDECQKDEEVSSALVSMTESLGVLTIRIDVDGSSGPFSLVLNVGDVTTDAIFSFNQANQ